MLSFKSLFKPLFAGRKPLDEFQECWSTVKSEHLELANETKSKASANAKLRPNSTLEASLRRMLQIVINESKEQRGEDGMYETTGPCLEYLLNQRILESLCMMGLSDRPIGLMAVVMQAFYTLLKHIEGPLLPQMSVHKPVCQLIYVCGEILKDLRVKSTTADFTQIQKALVALIAVVWKKIDQDPTQLDLFMESGSKLTIFSALLPYIHAPGQIGDNARRSILRAVDLDAPLLHEFIYKHTSLAKTLATGLAAGYSALKVASTFATVTQSPNAGDEVASGSANANLASSEETLFFRLSYCDQLLHALCFETNTNGRWQARGTSGTDHAAPVRAQCVDCVQKQFIQLLYTSLMETSEAAAAAATNQARAMIEHLVAWTRQSQDQQCSPILSLISDSILGCGCLAQLSSTAAVSGTPKASNPMARTATTKTGIDMQAQRQVLRNTIIHRIDSVSEVLTVASLQLFGSLLDTDDVRIINSLLPVCYHTLSSTAKAEPHMASSTSAQDVFALFKGPYTVWPDSDTHPSFVPYLADAEELHIHLMLRSCNGPSLPLQATVPAPTSTSAAPASPSANSTPPAIASISTTPASSETADAASDTDDKGELGLFLSLLFNKLENALDNTQAENIELTGVLSKLCQFHDEAVHRHFFDLSVLNPDAKTTEDLMARSVPQTARSFTSVLLQLWSDAQERADRVPDFQQKLERTRSLLGVPGDDGTVDDRAENLEEDASSFDSNFGQQRLLEAYVVLEEFIKELAAIVQARRNVARVQCQVDLSMTESLKLDPAVQKKDHDIQTPPTVPLRGDNADQKK